MGKTGTVLNIEGGDAVVKLDKDGKAYQEVKQVKVGSVAKAVRKDCDEKCEKGKEKAAYKEKERERERERERGRGKGNK
jgi:hypothetical protein